MDVDLILSLGELFHKVAELEVSILTNSSYFPQIINLFGETLTKMNSKELNT